MYVSPGAAAGRPKQKGSPPRLLVEVTARRGEWRALTVRLLHTLSSQDAGADASMVEGPRGFDELRIIADETKVKPLGGGRVLLCLWV